MEGGRRGWLHGEQSGDSYRARARGGGGGNKHLKKHRKSGKMERAHRRREKGESISS